MLKMSGSQFALQYCGTGTPRYRVAIEKDGHNISILRTASPPPQPARLAGQALWHPQMSGDSVVATALLDRLLHHAVVIQIEGSSYRLREHADLLPENIRFKPNAATNPIPPTLKRRGRPPKNGRAITPAADR
jgi:hypothetical protein